MAPEKPSPAPRSQGRYRRVSLRMHGDARYQRLSSPPPCGKALWHHLLFGPHTGVIPGVSVAGEAQLAETLGWPLEGFRDAFREVFREGLADADWKARVVWLPNAIKHNPPQSANVVRNWRDAWEEIPECRLKVLIWQTFKPFLEGMGDTFADAFSEVFGNAIPEPGTGTGTGEGSVSGDCGNGEGRGVQGRAPAAPAAVPAATPRESKGRDRPKWKPPEVLLPEILNTPAFRAAWQKRMEERRGAPAREKPDANCAQGQIDDLARLAEMRGLDFAVQRLRTSTHSKHQGVCFPEDFESRGGFGRNGNGGPPPLDVFREPPPRVKGSVIHTKDPEPRRQE